MQDGNDATSEVVVRGLGQFSNMSFVMADAELVTEVGDGGQVGTDYIPQWDRINVGEERLRAQLLLVLARNVDCLESFKGVPQPLNAGESFG